MARRKLTADQSRMGRAANARRANDLSWALYNVLRRIAREEGLAPTLAGIADQLNARGMRTNRRKPFDFRKVGAALSRLGLDRVAVERWKQRARDQANEWQVPPELLYRQIWQEWQAHVATTDCAFSPRLVHPDHWKYPTDRDPDLRWRLIHPPPQARLVHLFLGAFEESEDD